MTMIKLNPKKKIVIDCCLISNDMRGMGIYLKKILYGINDVHDSDILLLTNSRKGVSILKKNFKSNKNITVKYIGMPQPILEQIYIPLICLIKNIDFLISSGDSGSILKTSKKSILIIHDVLYMKTDKNKITGNTLRRKFGRFYRKIVVSIASKKADFIITVSNFAKKDIIKELSVNEKIINIIPNGVDTSLEIDSQGLLEKNRRILIVSGSDKQKNLRPILQKLVNNKMLCASFDAIDVVGVKDANELNMKSYSFINFYGFIQHDQIINLYKQSSHFLIPSLYESFGIPAIEALMAGCKVFSSNTGALCEVLADRGIFFNPYDNDSINSMIENIVKSETISEEEYKKNLYQASKYLWSNSALKFTNLLNEIK